MTDEHARVREAKFMRVMGRVGFVVFMAALAALIVGVVLVAIGNEALKHDQAGQAEQLYFIGYLVSASAALVAVSMGLLLVAALSNKSD